MNVNDLNGAWCKGLINSYVARGTGTPERIAKSILTRVDRGEIDPACLEELLKTIDKESVQPFLGHLGSSRHQPDRLKRFQTISSVIRSTLGDG